MTAPPKESVCERHGRECDQIVDDFIVSLGKKDPDRLYHYTSAEGFKGIIESGALWATNILHMNDTEELKHGVNEFLSYLRNESTSFSRIQKNFWGPAVNIDHKKLTCLVADKIYSTSFSLECDNHHQWKEYANHQSGLCLEFSRELIDSHVQNLRVVNQCNVSSFRMQYKTKKSLNVFKFLVSTTNKLITRGPIFNNKEKERIAINVFRGVLLMAVYFKDSSWEREREYRIIIPITSESKNLPIKSRAKNNIDTPIPYTEFEWKSATPCPLKRVWIGPAAAHDTTPGSVKAFLKHCGYGDEIEVMRSDIPYRSL